MEYISLDIGGTGINTAILKDGKLKLKDTIQTPANGSKGDIINAIKSSIRPLISNNTKGIGVGSPGYMDVNSGTILKINNIPSLEGVSIIDEVKQEFNIPVYINNDANCFAMGEAWFGAGKMYNNIVGITLGTGLGAGIIINKQVYSGMVGGAGELGCLPYKDGIIEDYCASRFFETNYKQTGFELFQKAENNEANAITAFNEYGKHLGCLMQNILYTYAPDAIIIGGSISNSYKYFEIEIKESINKFPVDLIRKKVIVRRANLENAGLWGAAALCLTSNT